MNKVVIISLLLLILGIFIPHINAQMGSMMDFDREETKVSDDGDHTESVEAVLQEILNQQNVSTVQELDLSKLSSDMWERLGDAVMELQHPGKVHEVMDRMMGGEGSESLRQMHINMGQAYLGYGNIAYGPRMMIGGNMMGYDNNRSFRAPFGMMASGGFGILSLITWFMAIAFLASGTYFFLRKVHIK